MALTPAQIEGYRRRGNPRPDAGRRKVISLNTREKWDSLKLCAEALGYRQATTIWWHIKTRTQAKGRLLRYAS